MHIKYGEPVNVKTKAEVIAFIEKNGGKIGEFYDKAALEKIERENEFLELRGKIIKRRKTL